MPLNTLDTRLDHLKDLQAMGWLSFDVTHMGEPDGYLLSPCTLRGYRAVYGPRPKLDWTRGNVDEATGGGSNTGDGQSSWNWADQDGGDQAAFFTREQRLNNEGSWVLLAGVNSYDSAGAPLDAQAKWWVTTQSDADTLQEELILDGQGANAPTAGNSGNYLGQRLRWRGHNNQSYGSNFSTLRRWTKDNRNSGAEGLGGHVWQDGGWEGRYGTTGLDQSSYGGIQDPGLGESSGLPSLLGSQSASSPFTPDSIWWVLYGDRPFLGITKCADPVGENQERDDHFHHGAGSNWRGLGLPDFDRNNVISPTDSAQGGYIPNILFYGGDIIGAKGVVITSDNGDITGCAMTDPGVTVVTDYDITSITPPEVSISMPNHYNAFNARADVSTDVDDIKAALPGLFKSKSDMLAELCDGYNDPIAQTFMVSGIAHPEGVFIPKLDLCFQSKPQFKNKNPLFVEIRPTVNGHPHSEKYIVSKMMYPHEVRVASGYDRTSAPIIDSDDPMELSRTASASGLGSVHPTFDSFDSAGNENRSITTVEFDAPVYLPPGEYAIVIRSNDSAYRCWISDTRGEQVGTASTLANFEDDGYPDISSTVPQGKQYGGVFFRSSNGRTWEPNQWQDLMFRLHKCNFGGTETTPETGTFTMGGKESTESDFTYHRMKMDAHSTLKHPGVTKFDAVLKTQKSGADAISEVSGFSGKLMGTQEDQVTRDLPAAMVYKTGKTHQTSSLQVDFTLETTNPDVSPVIDTRNISALLLQNQIDSGGLDVNSIKLIQGGTGYAINEEFTVTGGGSTVDCTFKVIGRDASGVIQDGGIEIINAGSGFHKIQDENGTDAITVSEGSGSGTGALFEVLTEEGSSGGNAKMRYVTKSISLSPGMSARAIKVYLSAKEPFESNIYVYYKVRSEEDSESFSEKTWKLMKRTSPDQDYFTPEVPSIAGSVGAITKEYEFDTDPIVSYPSGDGASTYDNFNMFAIKIVGMAVNHAAPPVVKDLRAIAVF